jgi:Xaa-Pro aminopeptidase
MTKDRGEQVGMIHTLQQALIDGEVDAALIFQNVDLFYYTGTIQDGVLLVPREGDPVLFIRRSLGRAREESPLGQVTGFRKLGEIADYLQDSRLPRSVIGLEMDVLPAQIYMDLGRLLPGTRFQDVSAVIRGQRAVKSPMEIGFMKEAGRRLDVIWEKTPSLIRPGRTEYEVYRDFHQLLLEQESSPMIRARTFNMELEQRILLSGDSTYKLSAMDSPTAAGEGLYRAFPYGAGKKKIGPHETFLIDMVFIYEGYMVDCTRVFATGRVDEKLRRAHTVSGECHALFLEHVASSTPIADIFASVWRHVSERGLDDVFMGGVRFIGHGVGLEIDEFPVLTGRWKGGIEPGMTIAFEPKFVFPEGTVGYENTYCIERGRAVSFDRAEESIVTT